MKMKTGATAGIQDQLATQSQLATRSLTTPSASRLCHASRSTKRSTLNETAVVSSSQPIGLRGRRAATSAPIPAKIMKTTVSAPTLAPSVFITSTPAITP
jgi:hypothetical protein